MQYRPELRREGDRYRGRRRAPTPPRRRYAAVVTTAVVGAGVVAFGAGAGLEDAKVDAIASDTNVLPEAGAFREAAADRGNRGERALSTSITQAAPEDAWLLPFRGYRITSLYGPRWGRLHAGIDLGGLPHGTPISAVHDGTVILAGWNGGYGNCVIIDHGGGLQTVYGHNSQLLVKEGMEVKAGDTISLMGNTGYSFGDHLHLEIHVDGVPKDPIAWFKEHGVDFRLEQEAAFGDIVETD